MAEFFDLIEVDCDALKDAWLLSLDFYSLRVSDGLDIWSIDLVDFQVIWPNTMDFHKYIIRHAFRNAADKG